jgi:hypothetical protein
MLTIWRGRLAQAGAKYGEQAPVATSCCNACRCCVQTNIAALALTGLAAVGAFVARRLPHRATP